MAPPSPPPPPLLVQLRAVLTAVQPGELVLPRGEVSVETRKVARGLLRAPRLEELPLGSEGGQVGTADAAGPRSARCPSPSQMQSGCSLRARPLGACNGVQSRRPASLCTPAHACVPSTERAAPGLPCSSGTPTPR